MHRLLENAASEREDPYHKCKTILLIKNALVVIRCLAKVMCFGMDRRYPTMLYTDHQALEPIIRTRTNARGRIARWMDRLIEHDYVINHRSCKANTMRLAEGISIMFLRDPRVSIRRS